jgi:hypothetical protein
MTFEFFRVINLYLGSNLTLQYDKGAEIRTPFKDVVNKN